MIVVIPTARDIDLRNLVPLIDHGCRFIVVDDSPGRVRIDHPSFEVYDWSDRRRLLGANEIAIPRGNGACRNLGFYLAWKEGADDEIIVALDDDCVVESPDFIDQVHSILTPGQRPVVAGSGRYYNFLELFTDATIRSQFPRAFPYSARVGYQEWKIAGVAHARVLLNLGLWRGVLDINAIDSVSPEDGDFPEARLQSENVVVPMGALVSVCSGNMQFRREVIPAIYQLPMNVEIMPSWRINRYGDIWGGFILKTLMDRRGDALSVGHPLVHHTRAGSRSENIRAEHLAHLVGDEFVDLLDRAAETIRPQDYRGMMEHLCEEFERLAPDRSPILRTYLGALTPRLRAWMSALRPYAP
jgi:hypothetical protein